MPFRQKRLRLTVDALPAAPPADLPDQPDAMIAAGDAVLLGELLINLIQNALTATPAGGAVTLGLSRHDGRIECSVSDTGCGIPAEEIPYIFDRFYKVDRARSSQGSGLGLSLCKWIVEAHHGRIVVESTVGAGSRFTVILPANH